MREAKINGTTVRLVKGDITDMEVEAFVFYASEDLKLGTGYGNAIASRAGPSVQRALDEVGGAKTTDVVVTGAGEMKAQHILHAVGPRFMEQDTEAKLRTTIANCFAAAEERGIEQLALPPMGAGFYGLPLDRCAELMVEAVKSYCQGKPALREIVLCALDNREYKPFEARVGELS